LLAFGPLLSGGLSPPPSVGAFGVLSELLVLSVLVDVDGLLLVVLDPFPELALELFALPYPSEYQPPPFKMKLPLTI
jgi:hypothetical protein